MFISHTGSDGFASVPCTKRQLHVFGRHTGYLLLMPGTRKSSRASFNLDTMTLRLHVSIRRFTVTGTDELGADIWPAQVFSPRHPSRPCHTVLLNNACTNYIPCRRCPGRSFRW